MMIGRYEKWEPVGGAVTPAARAIIKDDGEGLVVILVFSEIVNGLDSDLRVDMGRVPAYTVHEEFVHPLNSSDVSSLPKLGDQWENYTYPLLLVSDSPWLDTFSDSQLIGYSNLLHYSFVTLDQTVDVLSSNPPKVSWIKPTEL
jgi:hypothetical protein